MPLERARVRLVLAAGACALLGPAALAAPAAQRRLPREVLRLLARERVPASALSVVVQPVGSARAWLQANAHAPVNPASLAKLLTTYAALDLLGPAWSWRTPVWLLGPVRNPGPEGVLEGSLVIQGSGDPKLTQERVWGLLRRVQQFGVREIRGDIVLDQSAFQLPESSPADFDNEPLKPYNVRGEALLLAQKSVLYGFVPDPARGVAVVSAEPALAGVRVDASVPLAAGPCTDDWRAQLAAGLADAQQVRFGGSYPAACGERIWPVAYPEPRSYHARLLEAMWRELGGRLSGSVREGAAPAAPPSFELASPPLAEVVRDINKFSNNVMAQQLFLTLGLQRGSGGTPDAARGVLRQWVADRLGPPPAELVIDNGSGLSRDTQMSADFLARLLQHAWRSPLMPELMASLPVNGVDGTMRRSRATLGRAHLKTGSLRDVAGIAGYVLADSGQRYVLVAILQHANANAARGALDALIQWTMAG